MALWGPRATASSGAHCKSEHHAPDPGNDQTGNDKLALGQRRNAGSKIAHEVRREGAQGALHQKPDTEPGEQDGEQAHRS